MPHRLWHALVPHEVFTASYMGWSGIKNGTLLRAATEKGFAVFVTGDQTLSDEQNLSAHPIAVLVLSGIKWSVISKHLLQIIQAIDAAPPGGLIHVDCGVFARRAKDTEV